MLSCASCKSRSDRDSGYYCSKPYQKTTANSIFYQVRTSSLIATLLIVFIEARAPSNSGVDKNIFEFSLFILYTAKIHQELADLG